MKAVSPVGLRTLGPAIAAWLADFPRRTWQVATEEGTFVFLDRSRAEEIVRSEGEAGVETGAERGPWMRPSEVAALPEL
jgi:hypothetical protein